MTLLKALRGLVVLVSAAAAILVPTTAHAAAAAATLVRNPSQAGSQIYTIGVTATFDTNAPTTEFRLEFDLPSDTYILPWSELGFAKQGTNHWVATYRSANPQRAGGKATTSILIGSTTPGDAPNPTNCLVDSHPCTYIIDTDTVAPTVPGNLTATRFVVVTPWGTGRWVRLSWTASRDNRMLSGYEISANGVVVATPSSTATVTDVDYTTAQTTYSIRAFDWVRNYSDYATVVLPAA